MNRTYFLLAAGLISQPLLRSQEPFLPQQAVTLPAGRGGRGMAMPIASAEKGRPFSATATTTTTQTLSDGTHLNQVTAMLEYRDSEGRVRTEPDSPSDKIITIRDSVGGATYRLDPARKSAKKFSAIGGGVGGGRSGNALPPAPADPALVAETMQRLQQVARDLGASRNNLNELSEELGTQSVNGVSARGTRVTVVIPVGAIGNDKELRSVSERWFSSELNLLIKSINTDPRFGTTTYELTNISRQPPSPSLFQVPPDYSID
jgi:hypothetical protein